MPVLLRTEYEGPIPVREKELQKTAERLLALQSYDKHELSILLTTDEHIKYLNNNYRKKNKATNVLAFPAGDTMAPVPEPRPLGDIVICGPVVAREADEQQKPLEEHWAHIVIHACLHLCGYDHELESEAERMEARERALLSEFGIPDPYRDEA